MFYIKFRVILTLLLIIKYQQYEKNDLICRDNFLSLLLASCSTDVNDFEADALEQSQAWGGYKNGWFDYDTWEDINSIANPANSAPYIYEQHMITNITPN